MLVDTRVSVRMRAVVAFCAPFVKNSGMAAADDVSLFEEKKPFASSAVWACVVYSLVPFVGVVFVPFIFVFGIAGIVRGENVARAMGAGIGLVLIQSVLWWLLYVVPAWNAVR